MSGKLLHHDACGVGFLADLTGPGSHAVVRMALDALGAMAHRGARAADGKTGDGAGVLLELPRALLLRELASRGLQAVEERLAIVGLFLPDDPRRATAMRAAVERAARFAGVQPLLWRTPPADPCALGPYALQTRPLYEQLVVDAGGTGRAERMRRVDAKVERALASFEDVHACLISASSTSVVYKALVWADELKHYYADLEDPDCVSRFALFHQRYSTNTAPSWKLVQPFRRIAHNGEINTIAGNRAWLRARGTHVPPGMSDSHDFDVAVDTLLDAGYAIDEAVDLLLGAAIEDSDDRLRAYYDVHLPTIEHWDGPAAVTFYHANVIGAALDRSGFRPLRWCRTQGGKVLAASEAGILDFDGDPIVKRGRLGPGERLIARLQTGELVEPEAFRRERRERGDYRAIVRAWSFDMRDCATNAEPPAGEDLRRFAYSREDEKDIVGTMASGTGEPVWSMGDDAALPFLMRGQPVGDYLRQRFAQVTNPPIDSQRESLVFDMRAYVGCGGIHGEVPSPFSTVSLEHGILDEPSFDALCSDARLQRHDIALLLAEEPLAERLAAIADEAAAAVRDGASLIVLDNRSPGPAMPALLAAGCIHQRLTDTGLRMQASIVAADGYVRDAHSAAAIISAGANAVAPWLALRLARTTGSEDAFLAAMRSGVMKIMAKLGICTLRSYVGAQTFETLGLAREVVDTCFPQMTAHLPSVGFAHIERDVREWYAQAHRCDVALADRGFFRYRRDGVRHAFDPSVIKTLRASALRGDGDAFMQLSDTMDRRPPVTLRDLLEIKPLAEPLPAEQAEPVEAITRCFTSAAMSIGALSPEAHETVARAANRVGAAGNSGEGGEDPARYPRACAARSAIKQVASARFGVGVTYLASADEIEIKIAQGSKPGEGGQIPAHKVTSEIARLRNATPGQALISPAPHHDIYSIEDLAQLIYDLRRAAPHARIAVKLVAQSGIGHVAVGVAKAGADVIHISGHDGGTGASPLGSIKHAGLPWELGLTEVHDALTVNGLRGRIRLRVDGGFKTGRDVIVAALLGADRFGFGSALLVALGCIYARQCHKNTCPVGIATQDVALRKKFAGTPEQGENFFVFVARDVRRRLARMGARTLQQIRGRRDLLTARIFDDGPILRADVSALTQRAGTQLVPAAPKPADPPHLDDTVDVPWGPRKRHDDALAEPLAITPGDRAVGARIAAAYARRRSRCSSCVTPPLTVRYRGTAGQSFGAFLTDGIMLLLEGDANDYVGKSMEGGQIVVLGPGCPQEPAIGNACFYGARGGEAFVRGSAAERFGVRNSGATLVVEGAGDHACEYMTAGLTVILGPTGRNVASGMSGGTLFVLSRDERELQLGPADVAVLRCSIGDPQLDVLHAAIRKHASLTASAAARELLADWPKRCERFVKIVPASHVQEGAVCHVTH